MDSFELSVLERLAPTADISSFHDKLDCLRFDLDTILAPSLDDREFAPTAPTDETFICSI